MTRERNIIRGRSSTRGLIIFKNKVKGKNVKEINMEYAYGVNVK